jgi:hypothetical protein
VIEPLLPTKVLGVPRADGRKVLTGGARLTIGRAFFKPYRLLTMAMRRFDACSIRVHPARRQWPKKTADPIAWAARTAA